MSGLAFSKVLSVVAVHRECTRALTFENACQALDFQRAIDGSDGTVYIHIYVYMYVYVYIYIYTHTHSLTHSHTLTTHICTHIHTHAHTCTHIYIHTHTYIEFGV